MATAADDQVSTAEPPGPAVPAFVRLAAHPLRWRLLAALAGSDLRVRELVALVAEPQNLVSYHLRLLRDGGLVTTNRSSFDGRDTYYHLALDRCADQFAAAGAALHPALRAADAAQPSLDPDARVGVLFVCTGNSARSPVAEALLRHRTAGRVDVASAGSAPKPRLHPHAVRVLREEYGIVAEQRPQHLNAVAGRHFDHVITLCDKVREAMPAPSGRPRVAHWSIPDPAAAPADRTAFERAAADIDARVQTLIPALRAA